MSRRKRYSAEFKREALRRASEEGVTDVLVAEESAAICRLFSKRIRVRFAPARCDGHGRHSAVRSRDNDDLTDTLFLAHTPKCFPRITERVTPIDDRCDITRFKQLSHMDQVFAP